MKENEKEEKSGENECTIEISAGDNGEVGLKDGENQGNQEQCRVCQDLSDEPLIELGCGCRGELSKAHKSCIETWFELRGSNICEICQQLAENVPTPKSCTGKDYMIWRIGPVTHGSEVRPSPENERRSACPVYFALCILIGGLLLDIFVSLTLGISALPVNIMFAALILLSLGTALRIGLRCSAEGSLMMFWRRRAAVESTPPV